MGDKLTKSPHIRFAGFTEDWEQCELKQVIKSELKGKAKAEMAGTESVYLETSYLNGGEVSYVNSPKNVEKDDVLILWDGSQAGTVYHGFEGALGSTLKAYKPKESGEFLYQYLKRYQQVIYDSYRTPNIPHVVKTFAVEFNVSIPLKEEQNKIGKLFDTIDNLITLHQRKLELLKVTKRSMLQKMFPKDGESVPEIRFAGFTDAWEQRKLADILKRRQITQLISEEAPRLAFASGQGVIPLSERKTNNRDQLISDETTKKYLLTEIDDIVYNPANLKYGAIDRNKYGKGVISPIYVTFTTQEEPSFIERIVTTENFKSKALRFEEGSVTKRQSVSPECLLSLEVMISTSKKEQRKLGNFFQKLDDLIILHQRELDLLKDLKKSMLQRMFI